MEVAGADTGPMVRVIEQIKAGADLSEALLDPTIPTESREFVNRSFSIIDSGSSHRVVAAFTYGREDVIPDMFRQFVIRLAEYSPEIWGQFRFYLERHIEHDDEHHGPVCRRIVSTMCGSDPIKWPKRQRPLGLLLKQELICGMPCQLGWLLSKFLLCCSQFSLLSLLYDFFLHIRRHWSILKEFHREYALTLCCTTKVSGIAESLG